MTAAPADDPAAGLTSEQAGARMEQYGPNTLPKPAPLPMWRRLAAQLFHFFALMLWVAGLLAIVGGMPQLGLVIFLVIVVNGIFAFVQEHRAERAAEGLRDLLPTMATVVRDAREQVITADQIVPGDLVLLTEGDRITADLTCLDASGALVDTSTLTGESVPTAIGPGDPVFAGCFLLEGRARAIADATGARTRLADIARLTQGPRAPTPLERDIHRLVRTIAYIAATVGVSFFGLMLLLGVPARDGFIFGIGVTVALVPEGLLPTVSLSLAIGAQRMAGQNALVRRLESVETLGATTFICTDKTGTLTQNQMNIVAVWTPRGSARIHGEGYRPTATIEVVGEPAAVGTAAAAAGLCSSGHAALEEGRWVAHGDPMEVAISVLATRMAVVDPATSGAEPDPPPESALEPELAYLPFDPERRMATSVRVGRVITKGAPEAVLAACADPPAGTTEALMGLLAQGLRVLAVAQRPRTATDLIDAASCERELELLGLLGFQDPPRDGVTDAIAACRRAGVRIAMITGDHPATARAIAAQIGLALPDSPVVQATDLPEDLAVLGAMVDHDGVVLARATPKDKLRIAAALQARGHIVAMTGDGVNDAPALKQADIGVAMGLSGTEVAREAADLVLLDDHFATIVAAVRQGRETFLNLRRFLTYHLTDNVAELAPFIVWALSGGRFPLALGVLQILALDLGTDTLPATALGAERSAGTVLDHPPVKGRLLDRTVAIRAFGVLGPTQAVAELVVFVCALLAAGWHLGVPFPDGPALAAASGGAFLTVGVMQMANSFACRSSRTPVWRMSLLGNRFLLVAVATSLAFIAACLLLPPVAEVLGQAWPPAEVLPLIALGVPLMVLVDAVWKSRRHRRVRRG